MSDDLHKLPVHEIRRRLQDGELTLTSQLLGKLRKDPRRGVGQLHGVLRRRFERERDERLRLDGMLNFERVLWKSGLTRVAGVDEAGTGPLAGPVVAAAAVFAPGVAIGGVDDSKKLDPERREELAEQIRKQAAIGIGIAEVDEIDRLNIHHAALLAMRRALEALPEPPEHVLVDARRIPDVPWPQNEFAKGDGLNYSIAAASILAKTHRDHLMEQLDREHPGYGLARHKGYATAEHQAAIAELGPSSIHRKSFGFLKEVCGEYSELFYVLRKELDGARSGEVLARFEARLNDERDGLSEPEQRKLRLVLTRRWKLVR